MELWIRSQDKDILMEIKELRYNNKDKDHSILAYDSKGVYRILGIYKTKERALEVLDELQRLLMFEWDYKDKFSMCRVYLMPEE